MSKKQIKFQILKFLEHYSHSTQSHLSNNLVVNHSKVNYCIKSHIEKGFIRVNNFRNNKNKIQYSYPLTPKWIEEKVQLNLYFLSIKIQEYDALKQEIEGLMQEAKNLGLKSL